VCLRVHFAPCQPAPSLIRAHGCSAVDSKLKQQRSDVKTIDCNGYSAVVFADISARLVAAVESICQRPHILKQAIGAYTVAEAAEQIKREAAQRAAQLAAQRTAQGLAAGNDDNENLDTQEAELQAKLKVLGMFQFLADGTSSTRTSDARDKKELLVARPTLPYDVLGKKQASPWLNVPLAVMDGAPALRRHMMSPSDACMLTQYAFSCVNSCMPSACCRDCMFRPPMTTSCSSLSHFSACAAALAQPLAICAGPEETATMRPLLEEICKQLPRFMLIDGMLVRCTWRIGGDNKLVLVLLGHDGSSSTRPSPLCTYSRRSPLAPCSSRHGAQVALSQLQRERYLTPLRDADSKVQATRATLNSDTDALFEGLNKQVKKNLPGKVDASEALKAHEAERERETKATRLERMVEHLAQSDCSALRPLVQLGLRVQTVHTQALKAAESQRKAAVSQVSKRLLEDAAGAAESAVAQAARDLLDRMTKDADILEATSQHLPLSKHFKVDGLSDEQEELRKQYAAAQTTLHKVALEPDEAADADAAEAAFEHAVAHADAETAEAMCKAEDAVQRGREFGLVVHTHRAKKKVVRQLALPCVQVKELASSFTALEALVHKALLGMADEPLLSGVLADGRVTLEALHCGIDDGNDVLVNFDIAFKKTTYNEGTLRTEGDAADMPQRSSGSRQSPEYNEFGLSFIQDVLVPIIGTYPVQRWGGTPIRKIYSEETLEIVMLMLQVPLARMRMRGAEARGAPPLASDMQLVAQADLLLQARGARQRVAAALSSGLPAEVDDEDIVQRADALLQLADERDAAREAAGLPHVPHPPLATAAAAPGVVRRWRSHSGRAGASQAGSSSAAGSGGGRGRCAVAARCASGGGSACGSRCRSRCRAARLASIRRCCAAAPSCRAHICRCTPGCGRATVSGRQRCAAAREGLRVQARLAPDAQRVLGGVLETQGELHRI
jgi:hypothetical protein